MLEGAMGLKTLTSKNALSNGPPQNPRALMSSQALSSDIEVLCCNLSPERGWRCGSTFTS